MAWCQYKVHIAWYPVRMTALIDHDTHMLTRLRISLVGSQWYCIWYHLISLTLLECL